jgi:predicted signal transduction protein with EAL and GGDEF domain
MSVTDEIEDHQARCVAPLVSLRLLARQDAGEPVPRRVVVEIARATRAVLAEAEAGGSAVLSADDDSGHHSGMRIFLQVRLDRLKAAADNAISAARLGDPGEVRRHLRRFDALTAAIWTVQDSLCGPPAQRPHLSS